MIRHPYGHDELDRDDPALDGIAERLQSYASDVRSAAPVDLAARIHAAVDAAPDPAVGWRARIVPTWALPLRGLAAAAVVTAAVVAALVVGSLSDLVRGPTQPGTTPSPPGVVSPLPSPSLSPSPSPSPSPSEDPATPEPSPTDDHGGAGETPEPSESDNSGPGGGGSSGPSGSDNSGPGSGGSGSGSDD